MPNEKLKHTDKEVLQKALRIKDLLFAGAAVVVTILNLWLSSKLYPLAQGIEINRQSVLANEDNIQRVEDRCNKIEEHLASELLYLRNRVDSIYFNTR